MSDGRLQLTVKLKLSPFSRVVSSLRELSFTVTVVVKPYLVGSSLRLYVFSIVSAGIINAYAVTSIAMHASTQAILRQCFFLVFALFNSSACRLRLYLINYSPLCVVYLVVYLTAQFPSITFISLSSSLLSRNRQVARCEI